MSKRVLVIVPDEIHKRLKIDAIERDETLQAMLSEIVVDRLCERYDINFDTLTNEVNDDGRDE